MKAKQLRSMSNKELHKSLLDFRVKLAQLNIDYRTKEVKDVKQIHSLKITVARILTIIAEQAKASQGEKS